MIHILYGNQISQDGKNVISFSTYTVDTVNVTNFSSALLTLCKMEHKEYKIIWWQAVKYLGGQHVHSLQNTTLHYQTKFSGVKVKEEIEKRNAQNGFPCIKSPNKNKTHMIVLNTGASNRKAYTVKTLLLTMVIMKIHLFIKFKC